MMLNMANKLEAEGTTAYQFLRMQQVFQGSETTSKNPDYCSLHSR